MRKFFPRCFKSFVVPKLLYGLQVGYRNTSIHKGKVEKIYELFKFKMRREQLSTEEFLQLHGVNNFYSTYKVDLLAWIYRFVFNFIDLGESIFIKKKKKVSRYGSSEINIMFPIVFFQ